jgi:hypothetical protein
VPSDHEGRFIEFFNSNPLLDMMYYNVLEGIFNPNPELNKACVLDKNGILQDRNPILKMLFVLDFVKK